METHQEFVHDAILAVAFGILTLVSGYRSYLYFTLKGSGKVVTLFYVLIFTTSFVRCIWFGIPSIYMEGNYLPKGTVAFKGSHWKGVFVSEVLLAIGTISLYAVFILLISFWANMLNKVEESENSPISSYEGSGRKPRGPLETFCMVILALLVMETLNIVLFLCRVYNAEVMILYDSALFSVVSLTCLYGISFFSYRIRIILQTLGYINAKSTKQQVQRILAITLAANIFFLLRVVVEVCIVITLIIHFLSSKSMVVDEELHSLWSKCILSKHWLEVGIIALELVVSSSVSSSQSSDGGASESRSSRRHASGPEKQRRSNKPREPTAPDVYLPMTPQNEERTASHTNVDIENDIATADVHTRLSATENTPLLTTGTKNFSNYSS
mmetsp:Transcript_22132/g.41175  ORF Transcript_22132/g.41175 Transcript_22132/m.41175 type:complete len:384 (-) Transcript_22132:173-1324(-)|eukprot:CAMPEP_0114446196 /NCGR_PEP_ID=MMETSP0103-20121206/19080_1 /TAXON_ID=37642 ORGANISM="Paraphysomonas imperforata, Strain PA2" /NCGR_SAMPLE_ID=MMETSP0103 /ASSEMBLY_ACC=CAM_ASM_000201 /LENGTH=383 /DNA_ID=CAMNT_0001617963 /DNA_START=69 /DNA_END=1220 /DNA_ORIENTATION=+